MESSSGAIGNGAAHRHRVALLATLASSQGGSLSRDKLIALLWPNRDQEHGRNLLNQSVYVLKHALGDAALVSTRDNVRLEFGIVGCDVVEFERAVAVDDLERAVDLYAGPFMDGFFLTGSSAFEHWVDCKRGQLAAAAAKGLERLAEAAEARGDHQGAAARWRALATQDPYESRVAFRLMQALDAAGNPAAALRHFKLHARLLSDELGIDASAPMIAWTVRLRGSRTLNWSSNLGSAGPGMQSAGVSNLDSGYKSQSPGSSRSVVGP